MTFDWSEYLKLAQELAGDGAGSPNEEAKLRSSVSRAYYAAFCKARNHLRDIDGYQISQHVNVHKHVRDQFKDSSNKARKKIGTDLDRLRKRRNKADYDDFVNKLPQLTIMSLELSRNIISALNTL